MKIKTEISIVLTIVFEVLFIQSVSAQWAVVDSGWIKQAIQMKDQLDKMNDQVTTMSHQYAALTGSRKFGELFNNSQLRNYLPANWQSVYDSVKRGGYAGLSGAGQALYSRNRVFDSCAFITTLDQKRACEARAVKPSQDQAIATDAFAQAQRRITQIEQLMTQINRTQDPKGIAELQGRIAIEQAAIQNEQIKLQLFAMVAAAEDKIQLQRERELNARTWSSRKGIEPKPIVFGPRR